MSCLIRWCRFVLAILVLLAMPHAAMAAADAAALLPENWRDTLQPVPVPNLEGLPEAVRTTLVEARKTLDTALQNPDTPAATLASAYGDLGGLYYNHFLRQSAEICFANAVQLEPEQFRWAYYSAWLAAVSGETQLAIRRFQKARGLQPDYRPLTLRMADAWLDLDELDKAAAAYRKVIDVPGLEAAASYGLGQIALLQRDYAAAIQRFGRVLEIDPAATRVHYPLAQAMRAEQHIEEAKHHLLQRGDRPPGVEDTLVDELQAMKTGSDMFFKRAMDAIEKRDYPAAVQAFEQGLALEPDNADARISYARSLYLAGKKGEARQALEQALEERPENVLGLFLLGVLHDEEDDTAQAVAYYQRVLDIDPAHAGANFYLANHYYRQGDYPSAGRHYARTIEVDPGNVPPRMLFLAILDQTGAPDSEIRRQLERALQALPEQPVFTARLARLLAASSDPGVRNPGKALALAKSLVAQQPIPPHQEELALAYASTGDFEQAIALQQQVMSFAVWSMPGEAERLAKALSFYRDGKVPSLEEIATPPLPPPQIDGVGPFRDYPAPKPY
jgi:tetratricopeptide (TPR) repeat protein